MESRLGQIFRALHHRNYRLFFGGQGVSLIGTWMTRVAMSWVVFELTKSNLTQSEMMLSVVSFSGQIPILALAPVAGVWMERSNRHRILIVTQVLAMLQSLALAWLALTGLIEIWQIILLSVFQGIINAVDTPARQAFLVEMIDDRSDLSNAVAMNSSMFNGARLIGPAIAAALLSSVGAGICFLIDGLSYLAVIAALLGMRVTPRPIATHKRRVWHEMREGFSYAFRSAPIRALLLLVALVSVFGIPYLVLMPIFAAKLLNGGPWIYGLLLTFNGMGALAGALYLASRESVLGLGRVIAIAATTFSLSIIGFAFSQNLWLSLALVFIGGFGMMVHMAASNTILQTIVEDDKRSRVMGFYTTAVLGMTPLGSLFSWGLAVRIGAEYTVAVGGLVSLVGVMFFIWRLPKLRAHARPMLERAGVLPQIATGLQSASQVGEPTAP